ncbi:MAG TPA: cyclic nucleotide-binding domain-containing protein [Mucilaginibacter sp.]|jgi:signal-transduction protein with cAMP-binding, CBS, and nucleotidyltransferase domain
MDLFKQNIRSIISLTDGEIDQIVQAFKLIEINKGENLLAINTFCKHYYFLEKGLLRLVYCTKDKEETSWVIVEGIFFTEIISLKSKKPTAMRIEALEPSVIFSIDEAQLNELCGKVRPFEKYLRLTWEENLYHVIQMKLLQQFSSAKEGYESLIKDKNLMQRIPQKYLASILGITPYSLSRLTRPKKT